MSDFTVRTDSVDVEQIMRQIRARIREKRGVDYTEEEIRELANVKLEKFLDPERRPLGPARAVPARPRRADGAAANYAFEDTTLYESHRGSDPLASAGCSGRSSSCSSTRIRSSRRCTSSRS